MTDKPKVPTVVKATFKDGVIQPVQFPTLPPACGTHAPLIIAAGSFCQLLVELAPEEVIEVNKVKVSAYSKANMEAFYRKDHGVDARDPWKEIKLVVEVDSDGSDSELQRFKDTLLKKYAAREVNDEHYALPVGIQVDDRSDVKGEVIPKIQESIDYAIYATYEVKATAADPITQEQSVECVWDKAKPAVIQTAIDTNITFELNSKENLPIEESAYPTPIQAYLYGLLHNFMECMLMRMASRDLGLQKFDGELDTILMNGNKNYDDGLDPLVFDINGGKINLDIAGDASSDKVGFAFNEAQYMSPVYLTASGMVETDCTISEL